MKQLETFYSIHWPKVSGSRKQLAYLSLLLAVFHYQHQASHAFYIDERQSPSTDHWSYADQDGWQVVNRQCAKKAQSPIDIQRKNVIQSSSLKLHYFNYDQPARFRIQNAHHTIKMDLLAGSSSPSSTNFTRTLNTPTHYEQPNDVPSPPEDELEPEFEAAVVVAASSTTTSKPPLFGRVAPLGRIPTSGKERPSGGSEQEGVAGNRAYNGVPSIKLDWLDDGNNEFKLRDIHFHWAERRDNGSEHAIDGRRAAMEMHLVHVKHGLDKSKLGITSDSIAVVAVLIESYRKSNADFNPIVSALGQVNSSANSADIEYRSIYDLLPNELNSFYTYAGSLTTPPCYQVVQWIVLSDRLYLHAKQIEMFRNLYAPEPELHLDPHQGLAASSSNSDQRAARQQYKLPSDSGPAGHAQHQQQSAQPIMPNVRQLQPLNNRTILASFAPLSRLELVQEGNLPQGGGALGGQPASCALQAALLLLSVTLLLVRPESWLPEARC